MACYCDDCDEKIDLDEANDQDGEVLCDMCLDNREDDDEGDDESGHKDANVRKFCCRSHRVEGACKHRDVECAKCSYRVPECAVMDRQGLGKVCPYCAHARELSIFTPPDHDAAKCKLCTDK